MIGEIRDAETAEIACQAANTGHFVLSTIHANDTIAALYRLLELGIESFVVGTSLSGILAQRLVRCLCDKCKVPYTPDASTVQQLRLPSNHSFKFFKPGSADEGSCSDCGGTGYRGRTGAFELLHVDDRISQLIQEQKTAQEIRAAAKENGMTFLRQEGLRLVVHGKTSLPELQRVLK